MDSDDSIKSEPEDNSTNVSDSLFSMTEVEQIDVKPDLDLQGDYDIKSESSGGDEENNDEVEVEPSDIEDKVQTVEKVKTVDKHPCPVCNKLFMSKSSVLRHVRVHDSSELFSCDVCKKSFTYKSSLDRHVHIHTGDRPYSFN
ncbi:Asparagine-rich zinc finger protein AZF1 [Blattella germanica]|nr:Asparagine-rich zinc finger protein AZF1 [Blattella germanica]